MLVVDKKIESEDAINRNKNLNIDEFIWPHGITPPLHHVRKRRFRKRVNKRVIYLLACRRNPLMGNTDHRKCRRGSRATTGRRCACV